MDESEVLRDILVRLDNVTQYIIEIKSDMILRDEYRADKDLAEQKLLNVQASLTKMMRDELQIAEAKIQLLEGRLLNCERNLNKWHVPGWVIAVLSGIASLAGQQGFELAEKAFGLRK